MFRASFLIRLGIAIVLGWYAVTIALSPVNFSDRMPGSLTQLGSAGGWTAVTILGVLAVLIVLSILPRIVPLLGTLALVSLATINGTQETVFLTLGMALATLSLVFIHEEHVPWRQRRFLEHVFKRRH